MSGHILTAPNVSTYAPRAYGRLSGLTWRRRRADRELPPGARWVCHADHQDAYCDSHGPVACGTFGRFLFHRLVCSAGPGIVLPMVRLGFFDGDLDGGSIRWRWAFWRDSLAKRQLREVEQRWGRRAA